MFYGIDKYYLILVLPAILLSLYAQYKVNDAYDKYSKVDSGTNLTGAQVARIILDKNGLGAVRVLSVQGKLSDHYDPRSKTVRLSEQIFSGTSVASISVAAHEVGHAIQDEKDYVPMKIRSGLVPIVNIGTTLSMPLILIGFLLSLTNLVYIGIFLFSFAVLFQIVTLPVEIDASRRALNNLSDVILTENGSLKHSKKMLSAAALTYVAATLVSLAQLVRFMLIANRRDRR